MGVTLKDARVEVEKIIGRGSGFVAVEIPFTPRAKRVLELSLEEARALGAWLRRRGRTGLEGRGRSAQRGALREMLRRRRACLRAASSRACAPRPCRRAPSCAQPHPGPSLHPFPSQARAPCRAPPSSPSPRALFKYLPRPRLSTTHPPSLTAGHNYIGTEHILLGLLREGEGVASRVLETLGADPQKIRTQVGGRALRALRLPCLAWPRQRLFSSAWLSLCVTCLRCAWRPPALCATCTPFVPPALCVTQSVPAPVTLCQVIRMVGESQEPVGSTVGGGSSGR